MDSSRVPSAVSSAEPSEENSSGVAASGTWSISKEAKGVFR